MILQQLAFDEIIAKHYDVVSKNIEQVNIIKSTNEIIQTTKPSAVRNLLKIAMEVTKCARIKKTAPTNSNNKPAIPTFSIPHR